MKQWIAWIVVLLAVPAAIVAGESQAPQRLPDQSTVMNSGGFLGAHPDLHWRREGVIALADGRKGEALTYFRRAARYADKASQAMVAEMLWTGTGTPVDRPLAYAWMDIAAERAYIPFVAKREEYWKALDMEEREEALRVGAAIHDEYRDAVAKPRLERELVRGKRKITGSRVGHLGNVKVMIPVAGGMMQTIEGERFYDDTYWEPERYWEWQDATWKDPPTGTVNVKALEVVRDRDDDEAPGPGGVVP